LNGPGTSPDIGMAGGIPDILARWILVGKESEPRLQQHGVRAGAKVVP